jgi:hypothetical protein
MDSTALLLSFLFGMIGMGMFAYGRKAQRLVPLAAGVALMALPYFIPNLIAMLLVCCALTAVPFVVHES